MIALLGFCGAIAPFHPLRDLVQPATFTFGFGAGPSAWQIRHTWSLCVEEQFYLLWPVILLFSCLTLIIATASFFFIESPIRNRFSVRRQPPKNLPEPSIDVSFSPTCMV